METEKKNIKIVAKNRKARYEYEILSTIEAGIELLGTEVKSIRAGKIMISDAYAAIFEDEVFLKNLHISPYDQAGKESHDPIRSRKLLLHKREIKKLTAKIQQQGLTMIPLTIYFKGKVVKIELGLAVGRKKYDKRQAIAKADADRRIKRATAKNYGSKDSRD